jgi:hypothetical protein
MPEVPIWNILALLRSIEIEVDHVSKADSTTEQQPHQAPSRQVGHLSSKPDTIAKASEGPTERHL